MSVHIQLLLVSPILFERSVPLLCSSRLSGNNDAPIITTAINLINKSPPPFRGDLYNHYRSADKDRHTYFVTWTWGREGGDGPYKKTRSGLCDRQTTSIWNVGNGHTAYRSRDRRECALPSVVNSRQGVDWRRFRRLADDVWSVTRRHDASTWDVDVCMAPFYFIISQNVPRTTTLTRLFSRAKVTVVRSNGFAFCMYVCWCNLSYGVVCIDARCWKISRWVFAGCEVDIGMLRATDSHMIVCVNFFVCELFVKMGNWASLYCVSFCLGCKKCITSISEYRACRIFSTLLKWTKGKILTIRPNCFIYSWCISPD